MLYLFAIVIPPLAVFLCAKPVTALLNFGLCLLCGVPGIVHAILVVNDTKLDRRAKRVAADYR